MSTPTDPEEIPRLYGDLRERVLANDKEGTIEIYYELLRLGRPLSEIMARAVRVLDAPLTGAPDLVGEAPAAGEPAPAGLSEPVVERLAPEPAAEGFTEPVPDSVAAPDDEPGEEALAPEIAGNAAAGAADAKIVEAPLALDNTRNRRLALAPGWIAGSVGEPAEPAMAPKAGAEALTEEPEAEILGEPSASDGALPDPELERLLTPCRGVGDEVGEPPEEALTPEASGEAFAAAPDGTIGDEVPALDSLPEPALETIADQVGEPPERSMAPERSGESVPISSDTGDEPRPPAPAFAALAAQVELHRAASARLSSIARLGLAAGAIVAAAGIGVWLMQPAAQKIAAGGPPASGATVDAGAKTSPTTQAPAPPATTSTVTGAAATAPKSPSTSETKPAQTTEVKPAPAAEAEPAPAAETKPTPAEANPTQTAEAKPALAAETKPAPAEANPAQTAEAKPASPSVAVPPPPASPTPVSPSAVTAPAPKTPPDQPRLAAAEIAALLARGDGLLEAGDIVSARLFYERASDAGNGRAALRLGATYDPGFLERVHLSRYADAAQALAWYRRASDLGESGAEIWIKGLDIKPRQR